MLAALGLGPAEEEIYRLLVARGRAAVHELAADGGRPESEVREVLTDLAGRGLVVRLASEGAVTRYLAAPPAVALGGELRRRRDELSAAEHAVLTLAEQHRTGAEGGAVEVISDIDAVRHRFRQLQESARQQVRAMMVPEQTVVSRSDNVAEGAGVRRGVLYRTILHREALTEPGALAQALGALEAGQQVRVADAVPVKLMIADHELAMLPCSAAATSRPHRCWCTSAACWTRWSPISNWPGSRRTRCRRTRRATASPSNARTP
ncbi:TrmB family transcriptional regulator [Streptomyces sp. NPDC002698]|uniref:TrmB family transcriptional regulator n=1 Tax=Streptomyces sp. NPDC002698 TaxID=3364660 RepID=UPI0036D0E5C6